MKEILEFRKSGASRRLGDAVYVGCFRDTSKVDDGNKEFEAFKRGS